MFNILSRAAKAGGKVLMSLYGRKIKTSAKSNPADLVTEADIRSQKAIVQSLLSSMAKRGVKKESVGFIGEENLLNKEGAHKFIIDPLDGTSGFVSELDRFAISIAYARQNQILAGLIYNPVRNIFYFAERNKGAYKISGAKKQKVSLGPIPLEKSLISLNSSTDKAKAIKMFQLAISLTPNVGQARFQGCETLSLISVAEGRFQANFNISSWLWDLTAAGLILEEAGAGIWDWQGQKLKYDFENPNKPYETIACHASLLKQLLACVS